MYGCMDGREGVVNESYGWRRLAPLVRDFQAMAEE